MNNRLITLNNTTTTTIIIMITISAQTRVEIAAPALIFYFALILSANADMKPDAVSPAKIDCPAVVYWFTASVFA